ncbi:MAG TPA: GNAT family N-acetyltransferase [Chthonomonadaceae bacterium]|nr:GNAT family N-acetyltransferase [Chthonomonadaceae bacterium]
MDRLRTHNIVLTGDRVVLRPMREDDWDILLRWNNDPDVLYCSESDTVGVRSLDEIQCLYRGVSQHAFCFIIEVDGAPIGECWLQEMNLPRVLERLPGLDLRRIDIMIGEKDCWAAAWALKLSVC